MPRLHLGAVVPRGIMTPEMSRILHEQAMARDLLLDGHQDQRGLKQCVEDWVMEEVIERLSSDE